MRPSEGTLSNPFPGLRPYASGEAHLFFGREPHVEALLQKLARRRFMAVVGTSGSGKSSLVLAGVLPRLCRGYRTKLVLSEQASVRSAWRVVQMRPGDDPMKNLAVALQSAATSEAQQEHESGQADTHAERELELGLLEAQLGRSQRGLVEACETLRLDPHENLLIIVDQFEELFRFRQLSRRQSPIVDPAGAFVQRLLRATEQDRNPIYVMLTLRSEFIGECVQFTGLAEAVNEGQYLLPLLDRDQREQAVRGPMSVVGAEIAPALVQRLLNDAGDMTDQLPVLQHALMRSFERWQDQPGPAPALQLADYEAVGGMRGALSAHAEEALAEVEKELGAEGLRVTERLFRALTERSAIGHGVRRPCRVSEVLALADTDLATLRKVVARFTGERRGFLIVRPAQEELAPDTLLDISHEALMRQWRRLDGWTSLEHAFASQLGYLHEAAEKREQGRAGLWRDPELALAVQWRQTERPSAAAAARYGVDLDRIDAFLRESEAAREAARAVELDAQLLRRFRKLFTEAKRSTLISLLAVFVVLVAQGAGLLDGLWPWSTRLKLLSVPVRYLGSERVLDDALAAVIIDAETNAKFRDQTQLGERLGDMGAKWRALQAQALTRLADAGAKVVVFDVQFGSLADADDDSHAPSPLAQRGTEALAAAIQRARQRGTAVVIAAGSKSQTGELDTHPLIARALAPQGAAGSPDALGTIASACISFAERGAAVFVPLLTTHAGRPHQPGLALAALSGLWGMPNLVIDERARSLFLAAGGMQKNVAFAGLGRLVREDEGCQTFVPGDVPAQQIVDLSSAPLARGDSAVIPFEALLAGRATSSLAGKIVVVGAQLRDATGELIDGHRVLECGATPWSCGWRSRWGMNLHLDALSNLLQGRAIRPIGPIEQLCFILLLCTGVAFLRLRYRDRQPWQRRAALAAMVLLDLLLVAAFAILGDILMDEAYHVVAMVGTDLIVGRLDKH